MMNNSDQYVVVTSAVRKSSPLAPQFEGEVFRSSAYDADGALLFIRDSIRDGYDVLDIEKVGH